MPLSKIVSLVLLAIGVLCAVMTFTSWDEMSSAAQYLLALGMSYGFFVVFDFIVLKHVDTIDQIVNKQNIAYAIVLTIPALLALAAACSL